MQSAVLCHAARVARLAWSFLLRGDDVSREAFVVYARVFPRVYFPDEDVAPDSLKARGRADSVFAYQRYINRNAELDNPTRISRDPQAAARLAVVNRLWQSPEVQQALLASSDFVTDVRNRVFNIDALLPAVESDSAMGAISQVDPNAAILDAYLRANLTTDQNRLLATYEAASYQPCDLAAPDFRAQATRPSGKTKPSKVDRRNPYRLFDPNEIKKREVDLIRDPSPAATNARVVGATALPNNQVLVTFSEPMDPATLTPESFLVPGVAVVGVEVAGIAATVELAVMEARLYSIQVLPLARTLRGTPLDPAQSTATFVGIEGIIREAGAPLPDNRTPWGKIAMAVGAAWLVTRLFK